MARILRLLSTNVFENLAVEEHLLLRESRPTLLLYVNKPTIVIGRTQNPWKEADLATAYERGIAVARRRSGGGTVYHDLGNLNFSFIGARSDHDKFKYARLVAEAIKDAFSVPTTVNKRADIEVGGKKISGAAYRITADRAYHHGTILINSDLQALRSILRSPLANDIKTLGAASIPARVCNLADHNSAVDVNSVVTAISAKLRRHLGKSVQATAASYSVFRDMAQVREEVARISEETWVYGQTPRFTHTMQTIHGTLRMRMSKGAVVHSVEFLHRESRGQGDRVLSPNVHLDCLVGAKYGGVSLKQAVESVSAPIDLEVGKALGPILHQVIPEPRSQVHPL